MPQKFHLTLLIHAHQPCGNFEHVLEKAYDSSYLPFIEHLEKHPKVHLGLHYSGPLLTWIEKNRPEYFARLKKLVEAGQVELVGGGFYEPILVSIPPEDQYEQITRLGTYLEKHFGRQPSGAWLAERVWEPQLPSALASANVAYTLVDDMHFLAAGFEPEELFGPYIAEDRGRTVWLYPGQKALRYLVPFGKVEEVIAYLRDAASVHPDGVAAMGDDMEKFGVWPGTYDHCYKDGWLSDFFTALEENSDWLTVSTPGSYLESHAPLGRADLPTASYTEMMEWALPTRVRQRYHEVLKEFSPRPEVLCFLRGGSWRGFFRKYPESNLLHKKMLRVSARIAAAPVRRDGSKTNDELLMAHDLLLRAQCNDAYWHGIFGGIYAPHLRTGTIAALDFRPVAATLVNSILRRPEAYHTRLREAAGKPATGAVASIHEQTRVKEPGLERFLRYDRWPRHAFRVLIFDPARTHVDYEALELREDPGFAGGAFTVKSSAPHEAELFRSDSLALPDKSESGTPKLLLLKQYSFSPALNAFEAACEITLKFKEVLEKPLAIGIESVINFLAPTEPDRFFETPLGKKNLRFSGSMPGPILRMEDGWQRVRVSLHAPLVEEFWVSPIETVSESEEGFERVYQGSQILAVWHPPLTTQKTWSTRIVWHIESF